GGAVILNGGLTIGSGTTLDASTSNFALELKAGWTNNGTFTPRGGGVTFNGGSAQNLTGATTFNNLTNNNSSGVTLAAGITVNSNLVLSAGKITTGANTLSLGTSGTILNATPTKYIVGTFQKSFNTGSGQSFTFHIGTSAAYTPITLASLNATAAGSITASTTTGDHPSLSSSGIDSSRSVARYWTLSSSGLVAST